MAELRTDEEQIDAIKNWWQSNGRTLTTILIVVIALVFGWKAWQKRQQAEAENASVQYQNLLTAVSVLRQGSDGVKGQLETAAHLTTTLKEDYADSGYAALGAMLMASVYVDQADYGKALAQLQWVIDSKSVDADTRALASLRSARILLAQDKVDEAATMLDKASDDTFSAIYNDVKGDILVKQGKNAQARKAYAAALDDADGQLKSVIELKYNDLATGEAS